MWTPNGRQAETYWLFETVTTVISSTAGAFVTDLCSQRVCTAHNVHRNYRAEANIYPLKRGAAVVPEEAQYIVATGDISHHKNLCSSHLR